MGAGFPLKLNPWHYYCHSEPAAEASPGQEQHALILKQPTSPVAIGEWTPNIGKLQEILDERTTVVENPDSAPLPPASTIPEHQAASPTPASRAPAATPRKKNQTPVRLTDPTPAPEYTPTKERGIWSTLFHDADAVSPNDSSTGTPSHHHLPPLEPTPSPPPRALEEVRGIKSLTRRPERTSPEPHRGSKIPSTSTTPAASSMAWRTEAQRPTLKETPATPPPQPKKCSRNPNPRRRPRSQRRKQ
ncbi:hypothetical protein PVAP13_1KG019493 [Panicum virgatum]|uniref:Uncharacterized protein n=1 Tax=Panicum virgatum TaxID=38727 RepID=A0A8T0X144_PANVG|nr:hypothetical protein PVAP13_1KG019493 [Panicum virgatum]